MDLHEIRQEAPERVLLVSVDTGEFDCEVSLKELAELVDTAGGIVVGTAAVEAGIQMAEQISGVVQSHVIPRPTQDTLKMLGICGFDTN